MEIILGLSLPFIGTLMGSFMVFFVKDKINNIFEKLLMGFAGGVMLAASIWSLILPSIELARNNNIIPFLPATIGIILGFIFMIILDLIPKYNLNNKREGMLYFAVVLHNIPEGMAVGAMFVSAINNEITLMIALAFSIGIAIQNIPEGTICVMPSNLAKSSKKKAFLMGVLSGVVEPIASIITILLSFIFVPILPYSLAFAAGAMIYVVVEELIPNNNENNNLTKILAIGFGIGFLVMMILDVALG